MCVRVPSIIQRQTLTNNKIHTNTSTPNHAPKHQHTHTSPPTHTTQLQKPPSDHSSSTHTILQRDTTLILHRAPQRITNPVPNPLRVHYITQSHVKYRESVIARQTGRSGVSETIVVKVPDETARGSAVVRVCCASMMHACL